MDDGGHYAANTVLMAVYTPHTLVQVGGTISEAAIQSADDVWTVSLRLGDVNGTHGPVNDPAGALNLIQQALHSWWLGPGFSQLHPAATISWVKCNNIGADGKYSDKTQTHRYDYSPALVSGFANDTGYDPPFVTVCGSLLTANKRGRAHRGRMYFPLAIPANSKDVVTVSQSQVWAAEYRHILQALSAPLVPTFPYDAAGRMMVPGVYSSIDGSRHFITQTAVGTRKDVQTRRKNNVPEIYTPEDYQPAPPAG